MADKIKCPKCGNISLIGKDTDQEVTIDYWMDNAGNFNWNCEECEYEWKGNYLGEEIRK